jgi:transmembrane sensor
MRAPSVGQSQSAARRARAEAAAWLAKLHGNQRSPEMEAGWRQWVSENSDHATAWELATDSWGEAGDAPSVLPRTPLSESRPVRWTWSLRPIAIVATCLVVASLLLLYTGRRSVTTSIGEQRTLTLPDGTRVELNTNTHLIVQFDDHARTVTLKSGEAYFNVSHERRPFVVIAGSRKIIAVGTSFLVRREAPDDALMVTLIEGRVAVAPLSAGNVLPAGPVSSVAILSPGKRLRSVGQAPPAIDTPSIDKETAWMRGQLIFDNTPLRDAISEFNRYNAVKIRVASQVEGEIPVGGIFRIGDAASFATVVAQAHNLKVITRDRQLVLESKRE